MAFRVAHSSLCRTHWTFSVSVSGSYLSNDSDIPKHYDHPQANKPTLPTAPRGQYYSWMRSCGQDDSKVLLTVAFCVSLGSVYVDLRLFISHVAKGRGMDGNADVCFSPS
jgi:hypothetical protein